MEREALMATSSSRGDYDEEGARPTSPGRLLGSPTALESVVRAPPPLTPTAFASSFLLLLHPQPRSPYFWLVLERKGDAS